MFRIGEFSKISQTTIKTLHHYDELGLLKPAEVDPLTGYRRYSISQLSRLNRIVALKELGFSLEHIARLLDEDMSYEQTCEMLRNKHAELEQRIHDEQARLARVAVRLRLIQQEGNMNTYDVVTRSVEPCTVASIREIMPTIARMEQRISEVHAVLEQHGIGHTGPVMTLFYHTGFRERDLDVEVAVPVKAETKLDVPLNGGARLTIRTLPPVEHMASLVYQGQYATLSEPYAAIGRWLAEHGHQSTLPGRELYLRGPHEGEVPLTEIQFPLE